MLLQLLWTARAASHSLSATWQILRDRQALMRMTRSVGAALVAACVDPGGASASAVAGVGVTARSDALDSAHSRLCSV